MKPEDIINFWFKEIPTKSWFVKDTDFDSLLIDRFSAVHEKACKCELQPWRETPHGRLAEIIILDQFSRNMFRDTPKAFSSDSLALALSQEAVFYKANEKLTSSEKSFLYMPFMHSESLEIHNMAVKLFSEPGLEGNLDFEIKHKSIIERFGRYPHRNEILNRESTDKELGFLKGPGSSF